LGVIRLEIDAESERIEAVDADHEVLDDRLKPRGGK